MVRHTIAQVIDDRLIPPESVTQHMTTIEVGSEAWYAWLNEPTTRSFAFHGQEGRFTARREQGHGNWYWYAYRSQHGQLHKTYLGRSEQLTLLRLQEATTILSANGTPPPQPSVSVQDLDSLTTTLSTSGNGLPSLPLLTTKLSVPSARQPLVSRPRLMHQLNAALRNTLTLLVAPAGWGKTSLLHAWHAHANRGSWPLAWISLDASDNDLHRFWTYVLTAINTLYPGAGKTSLALLYTAPPPPIEAVLTSLLNTLHQLTSETVLILDDYHFIEAQPIHEALTFLAERLPAHLHLVLASRGDPPLSLARLRAQGMVSGLRTLDLRFTVEESTEFLTKVMGLPLSTEQVAVLQARTEGWIAGLHLAALSLQGREDAAGFIEAFTGSHRYVVDYLVEEVLSRQPADVQDFLLQTSILERLCAPLCDAVSGQNNSQALLEHIERANLFLVALDEERQWYRYHHLFAEVLRTRLRQAHPALVPELHRRASDWFERHELIDEAITHALAVPDVEHAARLIDQYAPFTNFPSQSQALRGWLNRLPETFVRTQPSLCLLHVMTLLLTHQLEQALARIEDAERCLEQEMAPEQRRTFLGTIAGSRSFLARLLGDYERAIPLAQQALELIPEMKGTLLMRMVYRSTLLTAASAYLADGVMTPATERRVEATVASMRGLHLLPTTMRSISNLARFQLLQGKLRQAARTIEQVIQLASGHEGLQTLLNGADYYFLQGELLREGNQLERARQQLEQGMDLDRGTLTAEAEMITRGYLAFARLQQAYRQHTLALQTLDEFTQMAQQRNFAPVLLARGVAVRAQIELTRGNLAAAIRWAETSGVSITDILNYPREQEYLTLVRVRIAQGREQPTGPFLSEALGLLERLGKDAEAKMRMRSALEILLLCALALDAQGNHTQALQTLARALELAEPEGYIRLFLDEGPPMVALLRRAHNRNIMSIFVTTLLEAAGELMTMNVYRFSSNSGSLAEPLTDREREVLRLLMGGASNREIAQHLVLSVNTVKKHVLNICGKLGVQSRTQAIARASSLKFR